MKELFAVTYVQRPVFDIETCFLELSLEGVSAGSGGPLRGKVGKPPGTRCVSGKISGGAVSVTAGAHSGCGAPQPALCPLPCPLTHLQPPPAHSRDELKRHYNLGEYWIEVEMEDLASFDEDLADFLYKQPTEHLQLVSGTLARIPQGCPAPGTDRLSPSSASWRKLPRRWLMR